MEVRGCRGVRWWWKAAGKGEGGGRAGGVEGGEKEERWKVGGGVGG